MERIRKKLAEAEFFLSKLLEQEQKFVGDKQPFDYYLSASLSATRTVDYRLRHEHGATYRPWRKSWDANLTPPEAQLLRFMVDDRNVEVHESGSSRDVGQEGVEFGIGEHRLPGGTVTISGPPGMEPARLHRPTYTFTIKGSVSKATDTCRDYLILLQRMVDQFEAQLP